MATTKSISNEMQIRTLIEAWAKAVRAQDVGGAIANHTDDMVMFDVPLPLQSKRNRSLQADMGAVLL
jgi:ketosteroid isomerase-like protein